MKLLNKKMKQKGFTLVEILVVVVIIAILAALILPRFLSQPENAYISEAQQILGSMRRGYISTLDQTGTAPADFTAKQSPFDSFMAPYGMKGIPATNFTYACTAGDCTADSTATRAATGGTITLTSGGAFSCGAKYTLISSQKGCRASV